MKKSSLTLRQSRRKRIRAKIRGTDKRPRLSVFRSNRGFFVQIINDDLNQTLIGASANALTKGKQTKSELAYKLGLEIAKKSRALGISQVIFDRGGYLYHGRVEALARGAREGGLSF